MPRITISYRRDDSMVMTGRIFDRLAAHYGREAVFRDIDNIPPGADFRKHIDQVLDQSDIVLAIVGPKWVGPRAGASRLVNAADPVRVEIETVLRKDKPLIPILVQRASMPRVEQLPETMHDFAFRNAVDVDAGRDFDHHIDGLVRAMDRILEVLTERAASEEVEEFTAAIDAAPRITAGENGTESTVAEKLEPEPISAAEIDALRAANAALEARIAHLNGVLESGEVLRAQLGSAVDRGREETKGLTEELAKAHDTASARAQRLAEAELRVEKQVQQINEQQQVIDELTRQLGANPVTPKNLGAYRTVIALLIIAVFVSAGFIVSLQVQPPQKEPESAFRGEVSRQRGEFGSQQTIGVEVTSTQSRPGAVVTDVHIGSPAADQGIQRGDSIVSFNGRSISGPSDFYREIKQTHVGDTVIISVKNAETGGWFRNIAVPIALAK